MTTKRFLVQFLVFFGTLMVFLTFAAAESRVVIKDKNGVCEVVAAQEKTTGIIAGPFKTQEEAKNVHNKECPMEENPTKTSASYYETPVIYFNEPGPGDTGQVLECVRRRTRELNIKVVLLASVSGDTALKARQILDPEIHIIAVSHVTGFVKPNHQEMTAGVRQELISKGISVLTAQHAFGGVGRGIRKQLGAYQVDEIIAYTLRIFGQGTKVAIELALMAADAGLVRTDEDVISVAGTGKGVNTALVLQPANSADFLKLKVKEVICKAARF
ncbi:MAG: hypothetical protein NTY51_15420 [Deltaproteobacteria bacterium]|nr:hypothetical protein [Deltaproteobacteria bacterium]